ncbi:proline--tRNA ligase [Pedosphaera parvula]|uniref:Proline--tRNA ligase n=1 Tax=Pedosphaera parvula (strain Ellin514) TaxID=320771 RepID=B9XN55_PEDPL|nr:proline--tRNA ligase [Pedosphaera parvula]EEF58717.1 prolyl-tRNA synthetase [Pedosphaera parvula Ellin514]
MRWTQTLIPTLKETPAEAEITSHKLLLRAGLVRKLSGGLYTFMPLGLRALRKVEQIVREEMNRAGALELLMPAMQPPEIWEKSGRYVTASEVFFKVRDRAKKEWILGPTHEEVITTLVAGEISSYRQLPKNFYQIQTKFRDEIRPRFGLMRAKEFIMKDAYSFDVTDELAQISYQKMYDAYTRIFQRCGLKAVAVEADTGVMGGKFSHEFMVPAETGENEVVYCEACNYSANIEKAVSGGPSLATHTHKLSPPDSAPHALEKFATPGVVTIEALTKAPHSVPAHRQIKTLVYMVDSKLVILLMRGDDQLNEAKLVAAVGSGNFRPATADEIFAAMGAHPGSLGAVNFTKAPVYADTQLRDAAEMTTGANEDGFHYRNVSVERDIKVNHWVDLRSVQVSEACSSCGKPLKIQRAIEVGHVFKLGTKYSEKLGALFLDEDGKQKPAVMGCYGIGVTRTLQAIIEQSNDKDGIIWPVSVAPYTVCITPLGVAAGSATMVLAEKIYSELVAQGIDVILDDRDERPGVKFKDSELVGFPIRLGIGEKSLAKGEVELKLRGGVLTPVKTEEAVAKILETIKG